MTIVVRSDPPMLILASIVGDISQGAVSSSGWKI